MAKRNLTYAEWEKLSEYERGEQYKDLSDADKFRVRITMDPGARRIRCNDCRYFHGSAKCDAFPDRIPNEQIRALMDDIDTPCGNGYRFEKLPPEELAARKKLFAERAKQEFEEVFGSKKK